MKNLVVTFLCFCSFVLSTSVLNAQKEEPNTVLITKEYKVKKFYTINELNDLSKGALVKLYVERVEDIMTVLPYASLTTESGTTYEDLGIPITPSNISLLEKEKVQSETLFASVLKMMNLLVPYADKKDIVWAILLFEDTIKKANVGNSL